MSTDSTVKFRVSSALKDLIGKELITDEYVAIFELVKNSFDAYASKVSVIFKDIQGSDPKLIIKDDGKGMDIEDIKNKWLFVAYSAKKDGTEDDSLVNSRNDYRNKIGKKRFFAGAKGVGRFSCDRLGSKLNLISIKDNINSVIENIIIDWTDFEQDSKKEFINVDVEHRVLSKNGYGIQHGTILEISNLRDSWDRAKLLKLKSYLAKLINPNQENDSSDFSIELIVDEEKENDALERNKIISKAKKEAVKENKPFLIEDIKGEIESSQVNGQIRNILFETLGIKSTQIITEISSDGKHIETTLKDRGVLIYKIKEENGFSISNIKIHLFYLSQGAKVTFKRYMGVESVNYGSVFVYKNGFRIYPYGEVEEDIFGINKRKQQGYNRFFGTREILGRVEIYGSNDSFKETTSRDGGFIKNSSYYELEECFIKKALRRLERYVVEIIKWGNLNLTDPEFAQLSPDEIAQKIIKTISKSNELLQIDFDQNFIDHLLENQKSSLSYSINDIKEQAAIKNDTELVKKIEKIDREYKQVIQVSKQLEDETEKKEEQLKAISEELKQKENQIHFYKSVSTLDYDNILSLHHQIGIYANDIDAQLLFWNRKLNKGIQISNDDIRTLLEKIGFLNKKILSVAKFATKANFNLESETIEADLVSFIVEYVENIYEELMDSPLKIIINNEFNKAFIYSFKPIEVTIIIDNLINNSKKANAKQLVITIQASGNKLQLLFKDDGDGLNKSIKNPNDIFEKGYTTTMGSGLGLFHVKQVLHDMNGTIVLNNNVERGIEFLLEVSK